jgi:thioredoxin
MEKIINFQNRAEADFQKQKSIITSLKYVLAFKIFLASTLFAAFTWPIRVITKPLFKSKKESKIQIGNDDNIHSLLKKEDLVLIDFWAEWCGPCIMMNPIIEEFSSNSKGVKVVKINGDLNPKTLKEFKIKGLPHFVLVKNGVEINRKAGSMTLHDLHKFCFGEKP